MDNDLKSLMFLICGFVATVAIAVIAVITVTVVVHWADMAKIEAGYEYQPPTQGQWVKVQGGE